MDLRIPNQGSRMYAHLPSNDDDDENCSGRTKAEVAAACLEATVWILAAAIGKQQERRLNAAVATAV